MHRRMDHKKYGEDSDYIVNELILSTLIDVDKALENYLYIAKNTFDNLDHWIPWSSRQEGDFYTIDKIISRPVIGGLNPKELYVTGIFEYGEIFVH